MTSFSTRSNNNVSEWSWCGQGADKVPIRERTRRAMRPRPWRRAAFDGPRPCPVALSFQSVTEHELSLGIWVGLGRIGGIGRASPPGVAGSEHSTPLHGGEHPAPALIATLAHLHQPPAPLSPPPSPPLPGCACLPRTTPARAVTQEPPRKELVPAPEDYTEGSSFPLSQIIPSNSPTRQNNHQDHFDDTAINGEWQTTGQDATPARYPGQDQGQGQGRGQSQGQGQGRGFPDENRAEVGFAFGSPVTNPNSNPNSNMNKQPSSTGNNGWIADGSGGRGGGGVVGGAMAQAQRTTQMIEKAKQMRINPGGGGRNQLNQHQMLPGGMVSLGDIEPPSPNMRNGYGNGNGNANGNGNGDGAPQGMARPGQHGNPPPGLTPFFGAGGGGQRGPDPGGSMHHSPGQDLRKMLGVDGGAAPRQQSTGWEHEVGMNARAPPGHNNMYGGGGGGRGGGGGMGREGGGGAPMGRGGGGGQMAARGGNGVNQNFNQQRNGQGGGKPCFTCGQVSLDSTSGARAPPHSKDSRITLPRFQPFVMKA